MINGISVCRTSEEVSYLIVNGEEALCLTG
jgi:hypothetical protein